MGEEIVRTPDGRDNRIVNTPANQQDPLGQVLCFVSAKGGTGKTVLSATTAYTLLQSGMRVVAIDADFSTRGLSLYLLGSVLDSSELIIQSKNCLADAILDKVDICDVTPLPVLNGGVEYKLIISNKEVWRGGVPEERFLGGNLQEQTTTTPEQYFLFLQELCERLRREFDYVIIDTRGGYDFTSAAPAAVADGYVLVLEADKVSIEQVGAFKKKVDEFAESLSRHEQQRIIASLKGFIINKALFSADEEVFPEALARLYESKTFGVVPADNDVIRSYQRKNIPLEKYPASDFSYYSLQAIERIISPSVNWQSPACKKKFRSFHSSVRSAWVSRRSVERLQGWIPAVLIALAAASIIFYLLFKEGAFEKALQTFYVALAVFMLFAVASSMLRFLSFLQKGGAPRGWRYLVAASSLAVMLGLVYLTAYDIPKTFSQDSLLEAIKERDAIVARQSTENTSLEIEKKKAIEEAQILTFDKQQALQMINDQNTQLIDLQNQLTQARAQGSAARRDLNTAKNSLFGVQQQLDFCQQLLDKCESKTR